mgnify:FL=1
MIKIKCLSDPICPWCYIGKKCLDKAISKFNSNLIQVNWVPFQLNPNMPKEGITRKKYLIQKFGSEKKIIEIYNPIVHKLKENDIEFDFSKIQFTPNTINANRLIYWAQLEEKGTLLVENLFKAYFAEGKDIGNIDSLIEISRKSGLSKKITKKMLEHDEKIDIILETENKYRDAGVTGVPTFIINDDYVVPGAQTKEFWLEVFEEVFQKNGRNYI